MHSRLTGLHSIFNNFQLVGFFPSKFVMRMRSCQCCSFCDLSLKTSFHVVCTVMLSQKRLLVKYFHLSCLANLFATKYHFAHAYYKFALFALSSTQITPFSKVLAQCTVV